MVSMIQVKSTAPNPASTPITPANRTVSVPLGTAPRGAIASAASRSRSRHVWLSGVGDEGDMSGGNCKGGGRSRETTA